MTTLSATADEKHQIVLSVMASSESLVLQYYGEDAEPHLVALKVAIPAGKWNHVALQFYDQHLSVFINGCHKECTPSAYQKLPSRINGTVLESAHLIVGDRFKGQLSFQ